MALLTVLDTEAGLARAAAHRIAEIIQTAVRERGAALVSLTGGTTIRAAYRTLASVEGPWRRVHVFFGDERHVPPYHRDSNFGMAAAALLSRIPIPACQIHRIRGELPAEEAARAYDEALREGFTQAGRDDDVFDLMLLGVGHDGHIASIFPGADTTDLQGQRVAAVWVPALKVRRITLTPSALLRSRIILVVAAGTGKAGAVADALEAPLNESRVPAQLLRRAGDRVEWLIDRDAARALRSTARVRRQ